MLKAFAFAISLPADLSQGDRFTAVLLWNYANPADRTVKCSASLVAKARNVTRQNAELSLRRLVQRGIIALIEKGNSKKANIYGFPIASPAMHHDASPAMHNKYTSPSNTDPPQYRDLCPEIESVSAEDYPAYWLERKRRAAGSGVSYTPIKGDPPLDWCIAQANAFWNET
jgi:hypothetical protein